MTDQPPHEWGTPRAVAPSSEPPPRPRRVAPVDRPSVPRRGKPVRQRARVWPWFFALIVLVFVLMVGCVAFVVTRVRAPIEASNAFVAHLDEGELDAAYDSLCSETRSAVPREQFKQDVALDGEITGYTLTSASAATGTLTLVSGTIEVDETPRNISFRLTREGDTWRVCTYDLLDRSQLEVSPLDG